jgi:hypothetical protein
MITSSNLKSCFEELSANQVKLALGGKSDTIVMTAGGYGNVMVENGSNYTDEELEEATDNGQLVCDKDDFLRLYAECGADNTAFEPYLENTKRKFGKRLSENTKNMRSYSVENIIKKIIKEESSENTKIYQDDLKKFCDCFNAIPSVTYINNTQLKSFSQKLANIKYDLMQYVDAEVAKGNSEYEIVIPGNTYKVAKVKKNAKSENKIKNRRFIENDEPTEEEEFDIACAEIIDDFQDLTDKLESVTFKPLYVEEQDFDDKILILHLHSTLFGISGQYNYTDGNYFYGEPYIELNPEYSEKEYLELLKILNTISKINKYFDVRSVEGNYECSVSEILTLTDLQNFVEQ